MEDETTSTENESREDETLITRTMDSAVDDPDENPIESQWSKFSDVGPSLIALIRLDTEGSHHGRTLSVVLYGWSVLFLWLITGYYMVELLTLLTVLALPLVVLGRFYRPWFHKSFCLGINLYFLIVVVTTFGTWDWDPSLLWVWGSTGSFYGLCRLAQKAFRTWYRFLRDQEDTPSILFWERIDKCMVLFLRSVLVLVCLAYVATIISTYKTMFTFKTRYDDGFWMFMIFATISFGSLLYFIVLTLLVRNRPIQPSEFSRNHTEQAIRRAHQLVLNPNNPLAEPLLLV